MLADHRRSNARSTVVAVDDEPDILASLETLLTTANHRFLGFASAESFLAQPPPPPPCCLLLDIELPRMSGIELQRVLSERDHTLPIIFLSGQRQSDYAATVLARGAIDYMEKPFDPGRLLERTAYALRVSSHPGAGA